MARNSPYFVWRRADGYVGCDRQRPRGDEFCLILETPEWAEAYDAIVANRDKRHHDLVASWESR